jgi:hypothetical protein
MDFHLENLQSLLEVELGVALFQVHLFASQAQWANYESSVLNLNVRIVAALPKTGAMGLSLPLGFAVMLIPVGIAYTGIVRRQRRS